MAIQYPIQVKVPKTNGQINTNQQSQTKARRAETDIQQDIN